MKNIRRSSFGPCLGIFLTASCLALPLVAQSRSQAQTISVALQGADIAVVAASFARMTESDLQIAEGVSGTLDLKVNRVTWMTALDAACEAVGCRWHLSGGHPRVLELVPRSEEGTPGRLDYPISIDLEKAEIGDVLTSFGQIAGQEVVIETGLEGEVTLTIREVTVRTALRAVCESVGCTWEDREGILYFSSVRPDPVADRMEEIISLDLKDAEVGMILSSFGKLLGCEVIIDESVTGLVTVKLIDVPANQALDEVCRTIGCSWTLEADAQGGFRLVIH